MDRIIKYVEWIAVVLVILGTSLTSFDIIPLNKYVFILANTCWIIVAFHWKKNSMLFLSSILLSIYLFGFFKQYFN